MTDYAELLDDLNCMLFFAGRDGKELWAEKEREAQEKDIEFHTETLKSAIRAIETLATKAQGNEKQENIYTMLVANLREEAEAVKAIEWDVPICTENHIMKAADAIEELCAELLAVTKERDAVLKNSSDAVADLCAEINVLRHQRDAAIEDLRVCSFRADRECVYCKNEGIEMCNKCGMKARNWHWRGCVDGDNC